MLLKNVNDVENSRDNSNNRSNDEVEKDYIEVSEGEYYLYYYQGQYFDIEKSDSGLLTQNRHVSSHLSHALEQNLLANIFYQAPASYSETNSF